MVSYTDEAIEGIGLSFQPLYSGPILPDKAIDLLDEAGARVKLRQATLPSEIVDIQRRLKFTLGRLEDAIANKDFQKAEIYKNEEQLARESLRNVQDKFNVSETSSMGVVTKSDIEDVVSRWTGVPVNAIKEEEMQRLSRIEDELHKRIVSQETAINALARAIRRSRAGLKSPEPSGRVIPVPRPNRSRQNGNGAVTGAIPVRQ
jgi:ATP-dependent Clp protease ATP-binding subunit ClpC